MGSIPGLGRSPGGVNGNPLQCSCLENTHGQRSLGKSIGLHRVEHNWSDWAQTHTGSGTLEPWWDLFAQRQTINEMFVCPVPSAFLTSSTDICAFDWQESQWLAEVIPLKNLQPTRVFIEHLLWQPLCHPLGDFLRDSGLLCFHQRVWKRGSPKSDIQIMKPKIKWDIHFFKLQIQIFSFWFRQCSHSTINTMNHDQSLHRAFTVWL